MRAYFGIGLALTGLAAACASPPPAAPVLDLRTTEAPSGTMSIPGATPPAPKPEAPEDPAAKLLPLCVRARLPDLAPGDGHAPMQAIAMVDVRAAIDRASLDMFVRYVSNGAATPPIAAYELAGSGMVMCYPEPLRPANLPELAPYAATTAHCLSEASSHFLFVEADQPPLPDGTPGLVWDVASGLALFVSLDGETYAIDLGARDHAARLEPGVGDPASWPKPVPNPGFSPSAAWVGRRVVGKKAEDANDAFGACADKEAARVGRLIARHEAGKPTGDRALDALIKGTPDRPDASQAPFVRVACKAPIERWERAYAESIVASVAERTALFDHARARVAALGPP